MNRIAGTIKCLRVRARSGRLRVRAFAHCAIVGESRRTAHSALSVLVVMSTKLMACEAASSTVSHTIREISKETADRWTRLAQEKGPLKQQIDRRTRNRAVVDEAHKTPLVNGIPSKRASSNRSASVSLDGIPKRCVLTWDHRATMRVLNTRHGTFRITTDGMGLVRSCKETEFLTLILMAPMEQQVLQSCIRLHSTGGARYVLCSLGTKCGEGTHGRSLTKVVKLGFAKCGVRIDSQHFFGRTEAGATSLHNPGMSEEGI